MSTYGSIIVSNATQEDVPQVWDIFHKHFEYDGTVGLSPLTPELVEKCLGSWSDPQKYFEVLIAKDSTTNEVVGTCLYQKKFSFYRGRIIWMDQLFVKENCRGKKIGLRLMHRLAQIAKEEEVYGILWDCLEWNEKSINFYKSFGATIMSEIKLLDPEIKILGFEVKFEQFETLLAIEFE